MQAIFVTCTKLDVALNAVLMRSKPLVSMRQCSPRGLRGVKTPSSAASVAPSAAGKKPRGKQPDEENTEEKGKAKSAESKAKAKAKPKAKGSAKK